jgi:hypothetical protein
MTRFRHRDRRWACQFLEAHAGRCSLMHSKWFEWRAGHRTSDLGVHPQCSPLTQIGISEASPVLHKCANPACLVPFRKLRQGKLFLVEKESVEESTLRRAHRGQSANRIEYYWLCDQCAFALTLSYEKGRGVVTVPRFDVAKKKPMEAQQGQEVSENGMSRTEQSA